MRLSRPHRLLVLVASLSGLASPLACSSVDGNSLFDTSEPDHIDGGPETGSAHDASNETGRDADADQNDASVDGAGDGDSDATVDAADGEGGAPTGDAGDDASTDAADGTEMDGSADATDGSAIPGISNPLAAGLSITDIVAYQAVGIALMQDGAVIANRNAPIVIGKDALFRVMVALDTDFLPREVVGILELYDSNGPVAAYESTLYVTAASAVEAISSTFNFEIPGSRITNDLSFTISLREQAAHPLPGSTAKARWPIEGRSQLRAQSSNGNFKITIVPYRYNGHVPETSEQHLRVFLDKFTAYPAPNIEITVHPVLDHSGTFTANGQGWNQLLDKTCNLRISEGADRDNYYFGLINPTANAHQFCGQGCVAGLAPLAQQPSDNRTRCGIGLGFMTQNMAAETAMHELGHALGREHAPCGLGGQSSDRDYPYPNAGIGSWGWEAPKKALRHPSTTKDVMSFCSPIWISDYTYEALFERIAFVNASPLIKLPEGFPEKWRSIVIDVDGSLHWGDSVKLDSLPSGTPRTVYLLDEKGKQMGEATGFFYGTHHLPGGSLVVPEDVLAGAKAVRIGKRPALSL